MANTLLTPKVIARQSLANLYESCVAAQLVHRDYEPEFAAHVGDTISIRRPTTFEAKSFNRATGIEIQDANEDSVDVSLNHFDDVSFAVTSEDLTMNIQNFDEQFLTPAMEALAQKIDRTILSLRNDVTQTAGDAAFVGEDTPSESGLYNWADSRVLIEAGTILNRNSVPLTERRAVVGPTTQGRWMAERTWRQADKRGNTEGLTEARFGSRVSGFDPYMTQNVEQPAESPAAGAPTTEQAVAFHRTAFALAVRPLALPRGAADAAIVNYKGFGLRVVYDYDVNKKQDVVSIDCLYGVKTLDPNRAVLIQGAPAAAA